MAVYVSIKAEKEVTLPEVILPGVRYGILDAAYRLEEGKLGKFNIIYEPENICRGFELSVNEGRAELRMPLPTGWRDTHFFYDYVRRLCEKLKVTAFVREDEELTLADIDTYIETDIKTSERVLRQMAEDIAANDYEYMKLCGVMNPVAVDLAALKLIGGDTKKLDAFMHRLQSQDFYYAKPNIYQRKDESLFGVYTLTEKVVTVLPYKPGTSMPDQAPKVDDWNLALVINDDLAGFVPYQAFLDFTRPHKAYDAANFVVKLVKEEMQRLLAQARVNL